MKNIAFWVRRSPGKPCVWLLGAIGISAVNIGVTTIHWIKTKSQKTSLGSKPGSKLLGLKFKASLRNKLSEFKFVIID